VGARVTAVVVEYRSGDALARCLESLAVNAVQDVVVVDNGASERRGPTAPPGASPSGRCVSSDVGRTSPSGERLFAPSLELRGPFPSRLRVVEAPANLGFGAGVNLGATMAADAELLLVCNPDVVLAPGAVERLCQALDAAPRAAVAGPALLDEEGRVVQSARAFPTIGRSWQHAFLGVLSPHGQRSRAYRERNWELATTGRVDWVTGACFLVRSEAFRSVGGFDPSYFLYAEEVDLCWRLKAAGWDVLYEPSARATHVGARSTSAHPYRALLWHHEALWRFACRTAQGPDRLLLPLVAAGLATRGVVAGASLALRSLRGDRRPWRAPPPRGN